MTHILLELKHLEQIIKDWCTDHLKNNSAEAEKKATILKDIVVQNGKLQSQEIPVGIEIPPVPSSRPEKKQQPMPAPAAPVVAPIAE